MRDTVTTGLSAEATGRPPNNPNRPLSLGPSFFRSTWPPKALILAIAAFSSALSAAKLSNGQKSQ